MSSVLVIGALACTAVRSPAPPTGTVSLTARLWHDRRTTLTGMHGDWTEEAKVEVRSAGAKGMGAFAAEDIPEGRWVGTYQGTLTTDEETAARYNGAPADYIFGIDNEFSIDAQNSTHFTRFFNHAQGGNLETRVDTDNRRIDFVAARDISVGEEMTFDCT